MRSLVRLLTIAATSAVLAAPAAAQTTYSFTLTGAGLNQFWTLPASPTPSFTVGTTIFALQNVPVTDGNATGNCGMSFYVPSGLNKLAYSSTCLGDGLIALPPLFEPLFIGSVAAPTFKLGRFDLIYGFDGLPATLEIATVVPEPSSVALLGAGLAGLAVAARRRKRKVSA